MAEAAFEALDEDNVQMLRMSEGGWLDASIP